MIWWLNLFFGNILSILKCFQNSNIFFFTLTLKFKIMGKNFYINEDLMRGYVIRAIIWFG